MKSGAIGGRAATRSVAGMQVDLKMAVQLDSQEKRRGRRRARMRSSSTLTVSRQKRYTPGQRQRIAMRRHPGHDITRQPPLPLPAPTRYRIYFGKPMLFTGDPNDEDDVIRAKVESLRTAMQGMIDEGVANREHVFW